MKPSCTNASTRLSTCVRNDHAPGCGMWNLRPSADQKEKLVRTNGNYGSADTLARKIFGDQLTYQAAWSPRPEHEEHRQIQCSHLDGQKKASMVVPEWRKSLLIALSNTVCTRQVMEKLIPHLRRSRLTATASQSPSSRSK